MSQSVSQGEANNAIPSPFIPAPDQQCLCGKKKQFAQCCGSKKRDRKPPAGVIVKRSIVSASYCDKLVEYAAQQVPKQLGVTSKEHGHAAAKQSVGRQSLAIDLNEKSKSVYNLVEKIFKEVVSSKMNIDIKHFVFPTLMRYESGGYYHRHTDSEVYNWDKGVWEKKADRDISLLIYLNNDFQGGDLHFNYFNYTFSPRKGDLVLFPSDHRYMHEAQMVSKGTRYVIVSWGSGKEPSGLRTIDG